MIRFRPYMPQNQKSPSLLFEIFTHATPAGLHSRPREEGGQHAIMRALRDTLGDLLLGSIGKMHSLPSPVFYPPYPRNTYAPPLPCPVDRPTQLHGKPPPHTTHIPSHHTCTKKTRRCSTRISPLVIPAFHSYIATRRKNHFLPWAFHENNTSEIPQQNSLPNVVWCDPHPENASPLPGLRALSNPIGNHSARL